MCRFKSGIILKNRCVIAQGENDSHTVLLKELNIEDTLENASRKFVRAELVPPNDEWWTDPDTWEFVVDQDIVPEWFSIDEERYANEFRDAVKEWCKMHIFVDQSIEQLDTAGYYRLKDCRIKGMSNDVIALLHNSIVEVMRGNSTVKEMCDNSTVKEMRDNSIVEVMWGNSIVEVMRGNSTVKEMCDNSIAKDFRNRTILLSADSTFTIVRKETR